MACGVVLHEARNAGIIPRLNPEIKPAVGVSQERLIIAVAGRGPSPGIIPAKNIPTSIFSPKASMHFNGQTEEPSGVP